MVVCLRVTTDTDTVLGAVLCPTLMTSVNSPAPRGPPLSPHAPVILRGPRSYPAQCSVRSVPLWYAMAPTLGRQSRGGTRSPVNETPATDAGVCNVLWRLHIHTPGRWCQSADRHHATR